MKHTKTLLGAAFAVACASAAAAAAPTPATGNKADKTQVMPSRSDLKPGAAPTVPSMDSNAQRQHDRNSGAAKTAGTGKVAATATPASVGEVRDWAVIDKNKDNLVSPDEMEAYLKQSGPIPAPKS